MTAPQAVTVSGRRRAFAVVSLLAAAVLVVAFLVFLVRNGGHLLVVLIGLAIAAAGAWWLISERGVKRAIGLVGVLVGAVVMTVFIGKTVSTVDNPVLRLLAVVVLLAIAAGAARLSLAREAHEIERDHPHHGTVPKHPVLICNPWSGGGKVEKFGLVELAAELGIETVLLAKGLDLEQLARDAIARGADCIGMAGGDGSQALVASIAVEHDIPFVCVTAGTRNHFALDLGLDREDPRKSMYAFRDAIERHIDYATVNGRFFVNNVSLGVYATIVQQEGYRDAKVDTTGQLLPELLGQTEKPFDLEFTEPDGNEVDGAFLIQVSNNPYVLGASLDISQRRRIDTGKLGVFAVTAATGAEAAKLVTLSAIGQRNLSPNWHEFTTDVFEVRSRSGKAYVGVDGEALEMSTPLRCEIHPGGLRLYVPEGNLAVAEQRRARDISLSSVVSVARGVEPADA
jgi:diacylglycerol kinase family enzyme/NADH:ubiquinone oxidoreductase subunit 6 (subunit J)